MKLAFIMYYDEEAGELMEIEEGVEFVRADPLMKADIIKDSIGRLQSHYDRETSNYLKDMEEIASDEEQMRKDFPSLFNKKGE